MTALHRLSKLDTRVLVDNSEDLFVDLSSYRTNLTDGSTYFYEPTSGRTALDGERNLAIVVELTSSSSGTLLYHGATDGSDYTFQVYVDGGTVFFNENGNNLARVDLPYIGGTPVEYVIAWSTFEVVTTSTLHRHEFTVYALGAYVHKFATATPPTTSLTWQFNIGGYGAGTDVPSGFAAALKRARVGGRFVSHTEIREDFIAERSPPTVDGARRCEGVPITHGTELDTHGSFAGPVYLAAGRGARQGMHRLMGPLVNCVSRSPHQLTSSYAPTNWHRIAWGADTSRLYLAWLFRRAVPPTARDLIARVHVNMWTAGSDTVPVYLRLYSIAELPTVFTDVKQVAKFHTPEVSVEFDEGGVGGDGQWVELGTCRIARNAAGFSYFALAYDFNHDEADANLANTRLAVRALTIDPVPVDSTGEPEGLDLGG